jgi:catechol 2,3-dioxygenase-like lactoylglutathione lyase family enzyme
VCGVTEPWRPERESLVQDVAAGTISVSRLRLDKVVGTYQHVLGLDVAWSGPLPPELAEAWGIDARPRRCVVLGPPGDARGAVRLVTGETAAPAVLATYGWSALEITVRDVDGLYASVRKSLDFCVNGEPHDLVFSTNPPGQRAFQTVGPAGEQLFLTRILRQVPGRELAEPLDGAAVGPVFIVVLAARDYVAVRRFYADVLGMAAYIEIPGGLSFAARVAGWPEGHNGTLAALKPRGSTRIEVDGYPPVALARDMAVGELPPGIGLASLSVVDLDDTLAAVSDFGCAPMSAPVRLDIPPYYGRRAVAVRGADSELVELIGD